jgi:hypothetical protein
MSPISATIKRVLSLCEEPCPSVHHTVSSSRLAGPSVPLHNPEERRAFLGYCHRPAEPAVITWEW